MASGPERGVGGHRIIACDRFDGDVNVEGQGGDRTDTLGGLDIGAFEFDAVGGHCWVPSSGVAMMVRRQGPMTQTHRRHSEAEKGRGLEFCSARNAPEGQGTIL